MPICLDGDTSRGVIIGLNNAVCSDDDTSSVSLARAAPSLPEPGVQPETSTEL